MYDGKERRVDRQTDLNEISTRLILLETMEMEHHKSTEKAISNLEASLKEFMNLRITESKEFKQFCSTNKDKCWCEINKQMGVLDDRIITVKKEAQEYAKQLVLWALGVPGCIWTIVVVLVGVHNLVK